MFGGFYLGNLMLGSSIYSFGQKVTTAAPVAGVVDQDISVAIPTPPAVSPGVNHLQARVGIGRVPAPIVAMYDSPIQPGIDVKKVHSGVGGFDIDIGTKNGTASLLGAGDEDTRPSVGRSDSPTIGV